MSQVIQKLRDVDPTDSDAVKEVITSFFQSLLRHTEDSCTIWLRELEDVITRFPRYCSQHRPTIEDYLAHFLQSSNYYNVIVAAKCAHGLQQIRPSQDKTASPKNCWREQMALLCNAAHTLIEDIFSKTVNIYKSNHSKKKKGPDLLANSPLTVALSNILTVKKSNKLSSEDKKIVLCNKLRNIFVFIQAMLVEVYPVAKPVQPQLILEVIMQALSVSSGVNTEANEAVNVKTQALRTLDAMILCLGPNLIPFSGLVFRFVMQTLKWSSELPSEESSKVRITAYKSLTKWLSLLNVHRLSTEGRGRSWEDELTKHIVDDVTPVKKTVQLTPIIIPLLAKASSHTEDAQALITIFTQCGLMSNQYTKNLSKKAKRKLANQLLQQSNIASHMPGEKNKADLSDESNDEVANAALDCAETFLTVCGIFLKPTTHKIFQERLVRECYVLDKYSSARALLLLRALDAARKNTPGTVPPPTHYCVQLYSTLVNSRCDEIRKFCSQALLDIRLHLHCSPQSINFALEAPSDPETDKNNRKEISEENIDVLESIIKERARPLSPEEGQEEAIGEPSPKRLRLEDEEEERISISSDSQVSEVVPEVSDDEVEEVGEVEEENTNTEEDEAEELDKESTNNDALEAIPFPETEESSPKTSEDSKEGTDNMVTLEDSVDTTDSYPNNNRKRKLSETEEKPSIYEAKTQVPLNTSDETVDEDDSPGSMEIAYDASNTETKVVTLEKLDDENLPSTNETDDIQITCGQQIVIDSQEPPKDTVEVEIEITTVNTKAADTEQIEEAKENDEAIPATDNNIEVKITSKEISVEDMLADFVDEVNEEPSLVA